MHDKEYLYIPSLLFTMFFNAAVTCVQMLFKLLNLQLDIGTKATLSPAAESSLCSGTLC